MNTSHAAAFVLSICWSIAPLVSIASPENLTLSQQVEEVASYLEGVMRTSAQAAINPKAPNVEMITCRVRLVPASPEIKSIILYQEQTLAGNLGRPYRQRFLQLSPSVYSQSVRSLAYRPANPAKWVGFCNQPTGDRRVGPADLGQAVCSVYLKRSGNYYIGTTPVDGCPANVRGAVRITNRIVLSNVSMETWDRGYDATGKQVWGAIGESYQFKKE